MATQEHEQTILNALQPIRDLAKNWDIDIAGCLDDYLDELDLPLESRERVVCGLNFAQAALVLQNSSCVYSRKVDYLHSYTFRMQNELLVGQQQRQLAENNNRVRKQQQGDEQVEQFLNYDPHQHFLLLDDVIPIGDEDKINLKKSSSDGEDDQQRLNTSRRLSLHTSSRRLSISSSFGSGSSQRRQHVPVQEGLRLMHTACHIGSDGALYIPGTRNSLEEATTINNNSFLNEQVGRQQESPSTNENHHAIQDDDGDVAMDMGGDYDDDNDHDDGPGFEMADDVPAHTVGEIKRVTFAEEPVRFEREPVIDEPDDPWEMLDPHEPFGKDRPIRIGKTIQLPSNLVRLPSEGSFPAPPPPRRAPTPRREPLEPVTFSGPLFGDEFAYIHKANAKRAAEERRQNRQNRMGGPEHNREEMPVNENRVEDVYDEHDLGYDDGDDDNDDGGGYEMNDGPLESNTGPVEEVFHDTDDHDDFGGKTFEELCRAHVQAFAKGAEKYATETQLATRVRNWQDTLLPQLQLEEERPPFDIHDYGATVLENMNDHGVSQFADVTRNCPSYEVCRRFLATLSLCNAGNVRFVGPKGSVQLELLDRNMDRPMEQYQAPSNVS